MSTHGREQIALTVQGVGSLNFSPLNPQNQSQGPKNDTKPTANPANPANPAENSANSATNPANCKALKKVTTGRVKPEAIMLEAATAAQAAHTCDTPKEIVTLEVEDMPVELEGEGYICATCYEIIPKTQYASHQGLRDCHSPTQPQEAKQDKLTCSTCHQRFRSKKANNFHEPCKVTNNNIPVGMKSKQPKIFTSAIAAEIRQQYTNENMPKKQKNL